MSCRETREGGALVGGYRRRVVDGGVLVVLSGDVLEADIDRKVLKAEITATGRVIHDSG